MRLSAALIGLLLALAAMPSVGAEIELARAEAPLHGPWAFRFGNDPAWASAGYDDRDWERVDLTPAADAHDGDVGIPGYVPGWAARGHAGQWGHAWYRLQVSWRVPPGSSPVLLGPTLVDGAYEIYWNGRRIGGIGDFTAATPRVYAVRPLLFQLGETSAQGAGVLAVHVYLPEMLRGDPEGGGMHVAPILAEPTAGAARLISQWWKTFWGYVVDLVEPVALVAVALFALSLRRFSPGDRFLPFAAASVAAIAASRINQPLFYWTDIETLPTVIVARYAVFNPLSIVLWIVACNRLGGRSDRRVDAAACLFGVVAGIAALPSVNLGAVQSVARVALLALYCWSAFCVARIARQRVLTLVTMLVMAVALFPAELSAIGIQGIWFPYGIGVSRTQYALALVIPLLALLVHLRASPDSARQSAA